MPKKADAQGLIRCVGESLKKLGVEDILDKTSILKAVDSSMPVLIGVGTDGAAVNISSQNGMMAGQDATANTVVALGLVLRTPTRTGVQGCVQKSVV